MNETHRRESHGCSKSYENGMKHSLHDTNTAEFVKRLFLLILFGLIVAVLVIALQFWCVVFAGVMLGIFLSRISRYVERLSGASYRISLACVLAAFVMLVTAGFFFVFPRFGEQLAGLSKELTSAIDDVVARTREWSWMDGLADQMPKLSGQLLGGLDATAILGGVFSSVWAAGTAMFLVLFVGLFLAIDPQLYQQGVLLLCPPKHRPRASEVLNASSETLWWWTVGRLIAMTVIGAMTGIGLWFLGVPMAITLGIIAGLVSFVPTIGAVLAIIPALLLSFQQGPWTPLYVLTLYLAVQAFEGNVLTPIVQQKAVRIPPVVLIVAQVLMGILVGIVGVVIATPLTALLIELVRELYVEDSPSE